jgi:transmembrane 9 superfamily protein 2/4
MSALWLDENYYFMGFLLVILLMVGTPCAHVSMVLCYLQLCDEDYRWWWKSFADCGTAGICLFLYSFSFLLSRLDLNGILSVAVYMAYASMTSVCFGLFCGSVGFLSSLWFTQTIYGVDNDDDLILLTTQTTTYVV